MCRDPLARAGSLENVSAHSGCLSLPLCTLRSPLRGSDDPSLTFLSLSIFLIDSAPSPGFISLPETSRLLQLPLVVAADGLCVCDNLSPSPDSFSFLTPPLLSRWRLAGFFLAGASPELNWEV